jgi:hypothetical protein
MKIRKLCEKKFYNNGPNGQYYKTFYGRNYATSGVFPYDFE